MANALGRFFFVRHRFFAVFVDQAGLSLFQSRASTSENAIRVFADDCNDGGRDWLASFDFELHST